MALPSYEELTALAGDLPSYDELTRGAAAASAVSSPAGVGSIPTPAKPSALAEGAKAFSGALLPQLAGGARVMGLGQLADFLTSATPSPAPEQTTASSIARGLGSAAALVAEGLAAKTPIAPAIGAGLGAYETGYSGAIERGLIPEAAQQVARESFFKTIPEMAAMILGLTGGAKVGELVTKGAGPIVKGIGRGIGAAAGGQAVQSGVAALEGQSAAPTPESIASNLLFGGTVAAHGAITDLAKSIEPTAGEPNAESPRTQTDVGSQPAPQLEPAPEGRVRVRDNAENGVETGAGEAVAQEPVPQEVTPPETTGGEVTNEKNANEAQGPQGELQGQVAPEQGAPTEPASPSSGQSNLTAAVEKNIADARMMSPDDPAGFLQKMEDSARKQGNDEAASNFAAAKTALESQSAGPGAAAKGEPLASYEKRRFGERFQESKDISPGIREATGNRYYEPIPNVTTVKEAEAIIEQRGTDESVRLVRDESFPMDHRVRSTLAQALIKKLNQSHAEAVKAGDAPAAEGFLNQAVDTAEYLSELGTKLGQGVQSFAIWSRLTPEGMLMAARRTIRKARAEAGPKGEIPKDLDPSELAELTRMAADINNTPEGFQRNEKMTDFLGRIADLEGANLADIPTAIYYANILSGYTTQLKNTVDTALNVFSEGAAAAASHPGAVPDILTGLYEGALRGAFEAADILKTGKSRTENKLRVPPILERTRFGQKGGVPIQEGTVLGRFMKSAFEKKPAAILNLWKYPLRAMVASDTVFYNSFKEARSRILAKALAKTEGLSGNALFKRVDEILNRTPEAMETARKKAESEGLTGNRLRRRISEIEEQGRPEELVSNADEAAAIATYNHDPTGTLGVFAEKLGQIGQHVPLFKVAVMPFVRIVANVANRGLDYTPWGYKRLFFGQSGGKRFATEPPVGEAYRTQLAKATAGTLGMATVAALDAAGIIQVTASGPQNQNEKHQLMNSGWKPYSVKIGDEWISYQYTPLNLGLAMVGHYRDAIRYNKLDEKDAQTRLAYGLLKSGSTILDMSFLSGLSSFLETVSGSQASTKGAGRLIARTGSALVTPNLLKQVDRLFDPTLYDANTVQQMLIRETPIARSIMLTPTLNVLGEPVKLSNNPFFQRNLDDPVWKLIVEKQAFVPVPSKTRKIGNKPINEDQYRRLIETSGKQIRGYIEKNMTSLRSMSSQKAQEAIDKESQSVRNAVIKHL